MRHLASLPVAPTTTLASVLGQSPEAFSRAEILTRWSRRHLERAVAREEVTRLLPGVYVGHPHVGASLAMARAIALWAPRTLLTGAAALHLHAPSLPCPATFEVLSRHGDTLHPPMWIAVRQSGVPTVRAFAQGVAITTPGRAVVDAWRSAPAHARRDVLWQALWVRVCTWRDVARELEDAPRVVGRQDLERVLGWFANGATSPLEVRAKHETFRGPAFREMEWQVALDLPERRLVVDMVHRAAMVVVELDGDRYHSTRGAREADRARQNALVAAGFTVLRFGWNDIVDHGPACRELLAATLHRLRPASR